MSEQNNNKDKLQDENQRQLWERKVIEKMLFSTIQEQRRARIWKIIFRATWTLLFIGYFGWLVSLSFNADTNFGKIQEDHLALINIEGVIANDTSASAENINKALTRAFENKKVKGIILHINSPGGSPVEADLVNNKITQLKKEYNKPIYSLAGNLCASAAYYMAAATDEIYANPASLVGSVGVIMGGFGFTDLMKNIGVERRLYTAGENKAMMDPFSPKDDRHIKHIYTMLDDIHQQFISVVKKGRGERLKLPEKEAFSGLIWTGNQAATLGIIDKTGSIEDIQKILGSEYKIHDYSVKENALDIFTKKLGAKTKAMVFSFINDATITY